MLALNKNISTDYFDGVRGLAVLIVWLSHTSGRDHEIVSWLSFHGIGHVGVMLFFVLSGFLLTIPMTKKNDINLKTYFIRRFLRVAPLYYIVILFTYTSQVITNNITNNYLHVNEGVSGLFQHVIFIKGDGLFWTIPTEVMFYLLLPLIILFLNKKGIKAAIIISIISVIYSIYSFSIYAHWSNMIDLKIIDIHHHSQFIDVFLIGVVFGYLSNIKIIECIYIRNKSLLDTLSSSFFFIVIALSFILVSNKFFIFNQPFYNFRFISFIYAISFGLAFLSMKHGNMYLIEVFKNKLLIFCGIISYSWYLLHFPVLELINTLNISSPIKFIISTILVALISLSSYLIIEKPFIKIGKKMSYTKRTLITINKKDENLQEI